MKLGRAVRTRLGRFEGPVSDAYRAYFVDLSQCAGLLAQTVDASSILEIGCGDGQMAGPLLEHFPQARYQGIDVAPEVGRLFRGDPARATFSSMDSRAFLARGPKAFDLVLLVDVLHHISVGERAAVLEDMRSLTAEGGHYALKDWLRSRSVAHLAAWASDRFLTGDHVQYFEEDELRGLIPTLFPPDPEVLATRVGPRSNNLFLVYRRS